jgi:ABC-type branched-subunit amino acid transport system substrate-binding protein
VRTQVLTLKTKAVEAVLNAAYEGDLINLLKALTALNFKVKLGVEASALTAAMRAAHPAELEGVLYYGMPEPDDSFVRKITARDPGNPLNAVDHAGMAYLHLIGAAVALEKYLRRRGKRTV